MMKYHDQRVNFKRFNPIILVLLRVTESKKDPTQGKLNPTWEGHTRLSNIPKDELTT